jgi:hypothetical protein
MNLVESEAPLKLRFFPGDHDQVSATAALQGAAASFCIITQQYPAAACSTT